MGDPDPIHSLTFTTVLEELKLGESPVKRGHFVEYRISLLDDLFQVLTDAQTFTVLNFDETSIEFSGDLEDDNILFTYLFDLDFEIKIQKRIVNTLPDLFGSITGVEAFFEFLIVIFIGATPAKNYLFDRIASFFLQNPDVDSQEGKGQEVDVTPGTSLKIKIWLGLSWLCCLTKKERRRKKLLYAGLDKLEHALDIRTIIGY